MLSRLRAAVVTIALFILLLGVAYPLAVTGAAQLLWPRQANGSLLTSPGGQVVGSSLIAQGFARPEYLNHLACRFILVPNSTQSAVWRSLFVRTVIPLN